MVWNNPDNEQYAYDFIENSTSQRAQREFKA
jgi:hypothetical protein